MNRTGYKAVRKYSITRVQKRFKEIYNLDVHYSPITGTYKSNRFLRFCLYDVTDSTGKVILHEVTMDALAQHLDRNGEYD